MFSCSLRVRTAWQSVPSFSPNHSQTPSDHPTAEGLSGPKITHCPMLLLHPQITSHLKSSFSKGMDEACQQCSSQGAVLHMPGVYMGFSGEGSGINIHYKVLKVPRFPPPSRLVRGSANCKVYSGIHPDSQSNANQHQNPPSLSSLQGIWVLHVGHWNCVYILSPTMREALHRNITFDSFVQHI